jgi:hypothetical protein
MKEKSADVDQQVSNVMGEVQCLKAKHTNLYHWMGGVEDNVCKLTRTLECHMKK